MKNLDPATGTIAGTVAGAVLGLMIFGAGDYDSAPWPVTTGLLVVGGVIGYFIGKKSEDTRFENDRKK